MLSLNDLTTATVVLAYDEAEQKHANQPSINKLERYPVLSEQIKRLSLAKTRAPAWFDKRMKGALKTLSATAKIYEVKANRYSDYWTGQTVELSHQNDALTISQQYGKLLYEQGAKFGLNGGISKELFKQNFPDIDLDDSADWCISLDGQNVIAADDYFVGNYGDFKALHDEAIAKAEGAHKVRLINQLNSAQDRLLRANVHEMDFDITTSFVSLEDRVRFLNQYVANNQGTFSIRTNKDGEQSVEFKPLNSGKYESIESKVLKRVANFVTTHSFTTGAKTKEDDEARRKVMKQILDSANIRFSAWVKSNAKLMTDIEDRVNDSSALTFRNIENGEPLNIAGINPDFQPRPHQAAFVRQQARQFGGICGFDVGLGKAQPLTANILTPNGWVKMGDIQIGDYVIARNGKPTRVIGVYPQGEKEIFEVTFSDGSKTTCCNDHLWLTQTEKDRKKERYSRRLGKPLSIQGTVKPLSEIKESLIYVTQKNHKIPLVEAVDFSPKNYLISPYLLGVLLGDGCFSGTSTTFTSIDSEIVDRVRRIVDAQLGDKLKLTTISAKDRTPSYRLARLPTERCNIIKQELKHLGLAGLKSESKFIPNIYFLGSIQQRLDLLRGLMDTDGYVSADGITVQFYSSSIQLAKGVRELVMSLGGIAWISTKKTTHLDHHIVSMQLPKNIMPFYLTRKANRVKPKSKYLPVRYIVAVKQIENAEAQCIMVEDSEHLYVTDDYIVTHNTFSALLAIQNLQSIHVKKKTLFCVPNTTLTNWRKEAKAIYSDPVFERCLFVGVREDKNGGFSVKSSEVPADLVAILENKHDKIFMTMEAFESISLKDDTLEHYLAAQGELDSKYEVGERTADNERLKSALAKLKKLIGSKMKNEFLELMGIDSLVIDEAHNFKNAKKGNFGGRVKWLSLADPSARGVNGAIKAWYVRGQSEKQDGVLCLTATPITNSPLEIYSMLSLAVGEDKVNRLTGIKGADQFLENFCNIEIREESTVDGREVETEVLAGLRNVGLLRKLIQSVATIKNADDLPNGRDYIPDSKEHEMSIALFDETKAAIEELKEGYQAAKAFINAGNIIEDSLKERVTALSLKTGEPPEVLAHPFNFINKVSKTLLDRDLSNEKTCYYIDSSQKSIAQNVIEQFNKLKLKEDRDNLIGVEPDLILEQKMASDKEGVDDFTIKTIYSVQVIARLNGEQIELTTADFENQTKFLKLAEKAGLALNVKLGSKMAALLENINLERSTPKAKGGVCKQIIFCDMLGSHNKIKQALVKKAHIPANKIVIFNAKSVKDSGEVQAIQDGFNADTIFDENGTMISENKYEIIIANKKAEVGINLQKGTQAIHHLTVGWTPDSLQQRNGRGVRQGNYLAQEDISVNVYHYDANGSFDSYKRKLIGNKASWINGLMYGNENKVSIENGLSKKDQEYLADLMGDEEAYKRAEEDLQKRNEEKRLARVKQDLANTHQMLKTVQSEANNIAYFENYLDRKYTECLPALRSIATDLDRITQDHAAIDKQKQALSNEPKDSATYASKSKKIEELENKIVRRTAVAAKLWSNFVTKNTALYADLNADSLPNSDELAQIIAESQSSSYHHAKRAQNSGEAQNHPLYSQWEEEKGAYDHMIEDYDCKLTELAPQAEIDETRLQALKNGNPLLIDNFPALEKDLVQLPGELLFIDKITSYSIHIIAVNDDFSLGRLNSGYKTANFNGGKVIEADSEEAEKIYQKMAKNDEQEVNKYRRWSTHIPQVEKYIDSAAKIKLADSMKYQLNAENLDFSIILSSEDYEALKQSPKAFTHISQIYAQQGVEYQEDGIYAPVANICQRGPYWSRDINEELFFFYMKYNYPLNAKLIKSFWSDLAHIQMPHPLSAVENAFTQINIDDIEDKPALIRAIDHFANVQLAKLDIIEIGLTVFDYQHIFTNFRIADFNCNIFTRLFRLAADLVADYDQKQAEKANAEKAKEKEALRNSLLAQYLTVSGNTFHYKDRNGNKFRDSVKSVLSDNEVEFAVAWLKKDKSFATGDNAFFERFTDTQIAVLPANSWIIHANAWDRLVECYADDLNANSINASQIL